MADEDFTLDDIQRIKNALFCLWVGIVFGVAALAFTTFWRAGVVVGLVSISCYLGVARKALTVSTAPVLIFAIIWMADALPNREDVQHAVDRVWSTTAR